MEKLWIFPLLGGILFFLFFPPLFSFTLLMSILTVTFFLKSGMNGTELNLLPFIVLLIGFYVYYTVYPIGWIGLAIIFLILDLIGVGVLWKNARIEGEDFLYLVPIFILPFLIQIFIKSVAFALITAFLVLLFPIFMILFLSGKDKPEEKIEEAGLKGEIGKVVKTIKGKKKRGKIKIRGEYWWAKPLRNISLSPGEEVIVKDKRGLTVFVESLIRCPECGRSYAFSTAPQTCECGHKLKKAEKKKKKRK